MSEVKVQHNEAIRSGVLLPQTKYNVIRRCCMEKRTIEVNKVMILVRNVLGAKATGRLTVLTVLNV